MLLTAILIPVIRLFMFKRETLCKHWHIKLVSLKEIIQSLSLFMELLAVSSSFAKQRLSSTERGKSWNYGRIERGSCRRRAKGQERNI